MTYHVDSTTKRKINMVTKAPLSVFLGAAMLTASLSSFAALKQPHTNLEIATDFIDAIVNKKDFNLASQYLGSEYIEHDPQGENGPIGLKGFIESLKENYPESRIEIKRAIVDGDYVVFHVYSLLNPGTPGQAIVDIFRLENGKVIEHWDVTQAIPDSAANANGMF